VLKELSKARIKAVVVEAARFARCSLSWVLSLSNTRTDEYGGSFENRNRMTLGVVTPEDTLLFLRYFRVYCLNGSKKGGLAYQVWFAQAVKQAVGDKLAIGSVRSITNGKIAQEVLDKGQANFIFVGPQFQKNLATVWA
jgi:2,4-dienoyl-CoA reductase-like NADH-dependent reductase (Old Yellow Enzyme family)